MFSKFSNVQRQFCQPNVYSRSAAGDKPGCFWCLSQFVCIPVAFLSFQSLNSSLIRSLMPAAAVVDDLLEESEHVSQDGIARVVVIGC